MCAACEQPAQRQHRHQRAALEHAQKPFDQQVRTDQRAVEIHAERWFLAQYHVHPSLGLGQSD
jgi:hypothetical protein